MATETTKIQKQNEKIVAEFQKLRNEQRNMANNLSTFEMDLKEHKTVIDTLETVDENRKCFRLIGGVLCERTVKDVLPELVGNKKFLEKTVNVVTEQLSKKGIEINKFKEEHNIRVRGQEPSQASKSVGDKSEDANQETRNVLVVNN